jgi:hypothetical protein
MRRFVATCYMTAGCRFPDVRPAPFSEQIHTIFTTSPERVSHLQTGPAFRKFTASPQAGRPRRGKSTQKVRGWRGVRGIGFAHASASGSRIGATFPNSRASRVARYHASAWLVPFARIRFSPLLPSTCQVAPKTVSPSDQPPRCSRSRDSFRGPAHSSGGPSWPIWAAP